mmetsp:Transcript_20646/g.64727  ORF Transcript_20646/g.64727 Transcript_20646/m.64727 type:complete len:409 (+) Transcript_20646:1631-2857(+)
MNSSCWCCLSCMLNHRRARSTFDFIDKYSLSHSSSARGSISGRGIGVADRLRAFVRPGSSISLVARCREVFSTGVSAALGDFCPTSSVGALEAAAGAAEAAASCAFLAARAFATLASASFCSRSICSKYRSTASGRPASQLRTMRASSSASRMAAFKWFTSDDGPPAASFMAFASCNSSTSMELNAAAAWSCAVRRWLATVRAISQVVSSTPTSLAASTAASSSSAPAPLMMASLTTCRLALSSVLCERQARIMGRGRLPRFCKANFIAIRCRSALLIATWATPAWRASSIAWASSSGFPLWAALRISLSRLIRRSSATLSARSSASSFLSRSASSVWPASSAMASACSRARMELAEALAAASCVWAGRVLAVAALASPPGVWAAFTRSRVLSPSAIKAGSMSPTPAC